MGEGLGNVPSVDRLSRIHGLMAVSKLSYKEAERLVERAERTGEAAIDIWARELVQSTRHPQKNVI